MKAMMPFTPHLSCECLSKLEEKDFYPKIEWPKIEKSLLIDEKVTIVIQVNGKKRENRIERSFESTLTDLNCTVLYSK